MEREPARRPPSAAVLARMLRSPQRPGVAASTRPVPTGILPARGDTDVLPAGAVASEAGAPPTEVVQRADTEATRKIERRAARSTPPVPVRRAAGSVPSAPPRRRPPSRSSPSRGGSSSRRRGRYLIAATAIALAVGGFVLLAIAGTPSDRPDRGASPPPKPDASRPPRQRQLVPAVVGDSIDQAQAALVNAGLRIGSILVVEGPKNVVVRTDPLVGAPVADGGTVTLFVGGQGPGHPPKPPGEDHHHHHPPGQGGQGGD